MWVLACVKFVGQAGRLEIQGRVDTASQLRIPQGSRLETRAELLCCSLEKSSFYIWEPRLFSQGLQLIEQGYSHCGG